MFEELIAHPELYGITRSSCWENDVGIKFSSELLSEDGYPLEDRVLILKLDEFYSSARMHNPPPSVDCLVLVKCNEENTYSMFLIELRNTKLTSSVRPKDIKKKFDTAITDFIQNRFSDIFLNEKYYIAKINLYLVTDPLQLVKKNLSEDEVRKYILGTVLDAYATIEPINGLGRYLQIKPLLPSPAIETC